MSDIIVHGFDGSPFVRAVEMCLIEKGIEYRVKRMLPGDHRTPEFVQLNPFSRVPVFEHGNYRLYESQAIVRYLDAVFPEPALQPTDPRAIGRMNQIIGINDWYFFPKVAAVVVFNRIVGPALLGLPPDEPAIEAALPLARTCITELDRLLGDQPYLVGNRMTLADLMLAPQLDFFMATPEGRLLLEGTRLEPWLGLMNERASMQRTQRPEGFRAAA